MGRNKGICTLCGKGGPLTFEHVPPEGGLNIRGMVMYTFADWMQHESFDRPLPNGIPQPEGTGLIALCDPCNRLLLGSNYVPSHIRLVKMGLHILTELHSRLEEIDRRLEITAVSLRLDDVNRLACAKQIVSMILVTCGRAVVQANPALAHFVRNPQAIGLPPEYRLFLAVVPGPAARTTGLCSKLAGDLYVAAEVVYPPFAYALTFNATAIWPVGEITPWASAPFGEATTVAIDLPVGFTHTALPCDLRTRAQVEACRLENAE